MMLPPPKAVAHAVTPAEAAELIGWIRLPELCCGLFVGARPGLEISCWAAFAETPEALQEAPLIFAGCSRGQGPLAKSPPPEDEEQAFDRRRQSILETAIDRVAPRWPPQAGIILGAALLLMINAVQPTSDDAGRDLLYRGLKRLGALEVVLL